MCVITPPSEFSALAMNYNKGIEGLHLSFSGYVPGKKWYSSPTSYFKGQYVFVSS